MRKALSNLAFFAFLVIPMLVVIAWVGLGRYYKMDLASGAINAEATFFGFTVPWTTHRSHPPLEFMPKQGEIWVDGGSSLHSCTARGRYIDAHYCMELLELDEADRRWVWSNIIMLTERFGAPSFLDYEYCENAENIVADFDIEYDTVRVTLWPPTPLPRSLTASPRSLPPAASPPPRPRP